MHHKKFLNLSLILLSVICLGACHKQEQTASEVKTAIQEKKVDDKTTTSSQKQDTEKPATSASSKPTARQETSPTSPDSVSQKVSEPTVNNQTVQTTPTEQIVSQQTEPAIQSISPGAASGFWQSASGYHQTIHQDGTIDDGDYIITSVTQEANGVLYMTVYSQSSGWGGYMHYYPAGVPLIFEVVSYDEAGNEILESKDYTDSSRERLFSGNGGYSIQKDSLEDYLAGIYYR